MKKVILFIAISVFLCAQVVYAIDRCQAYIPEIRHWNSYYWGLNFPYWYAVGQAQQESSCRSNAISFDGGQGLMQFMPATEKYCEEYIGFLNMLNPAHAIKANAWYTRQLHKNNKDGALWLDYMFYNGGIGIVLREAQRAGVMDYDLMRYSCKRNKIKLASGQILDLCDVAYQYPQQVFKYGLKYKTSYDRMVFW
jgi:soluble lytic murein transglycosylase-like protein